MREDNRKNRFFYLGKRSFEEEFIRILEEGFSINRERKLAEMGLIIYGRLYKGEERILYLSRN